MALEEAENMSIEKAKSEVYRMIQQGISYSRISQKEFLINGKLTKFYKSKISDIKKEFEPESSTSTKEPDKALVFDLFNKGLTRTQVLIETKFSYDFIKNSYEEFLEFEGKSIVTKSFTTKMLELSRKIFPKSWMFSDIEKAMATAIESHIELEKHVYLCSVCKEQMKIQGKSLAFASESLSQSWGHSECIDKLNKARKESHWQIH